MEGDEVGRATDLRTAVGEAVRALSPGAEVVVISPHCDDAVLSVGAVLAGHARAGGAVTIVTVLAGDPTSQGPPGAWDAAAGFASEGHAAAVRRREDEAACRVLGARPVHLDDVDEQYPRRFADEALWEQLEPLVRSAGELLVPGAPLRHRDHQAVAGLVLERSAPDRRLRLYREEPYALRERAHRRATTDPWSGRAAWQRVRPDPRDAVSKLRACACYRSQLPLLASSGDRRRGAALATALLWSAQFRGEGLTGPVTPYVLLQAGS